MTGRERLRGRCCAPSAHLSSQEAPVHSECFSFCLARPVRPFEPAASWQYERTPTVSQRPCRCPMGPGGAPVDELARRQGPSRTQHRHTAPARSARLARRHPLRSPDRHPLALSPARLPIGYVESRAAGCSSYPAASPRTEKIRWAARWCWRGSGRSWVGTRGHPLGRIMAGRGGGDPGGGMDTLGVQDHQDRVL